MASSLVRKSLWFAGGIVVALALFLAALPYLASTQIVRDRIALELSAWSGYRVSLGGGTPEIDVWPSFQAHFSDVSFSTWSDATHTPVLSAERVDVELSALSALAGHVVFSSARLVRPTLRVDADSFYMPASPQSGRLLHSIETAQTIVARDPANPDVRALPGDAFGTVEFSDGRIVTAGASGDEELASGIGGRLEWTTLDRSARLSATGIWRGENVALEMSAEQPLVLLGGGPSRVVLSLRAAPVTISYEGTAGLTAQPFFQGELAFATPSLRRMLEWSRTESAAGTAIGSLEVTGQVVGDVNRMKFEDTEIVLDGNPGVGVIELALGSRVPTISGTLAFENLDLRSFLSVFTPVRDGADAIDTMFAERVGLDLRLSAAHATAGSVELSQVAATAQVKEGLAAFDISDATAFGGMLQAGIRFDRKAEGNQAEIRLLGENLDGVELAKALGWSRLVPAARVTLSATLKGPADGWRAFATGATGTLSASLSQGSIAGFDLAAFRQRTQAAGFFPFTEVANGTLPIGRGELKGSVAGGVVKIEKAEILAERTVLSLAGLVPYLEGGLALSGSVLAERAGEAATAWVPEVGFFVGGSWRAPFIYPVPPMPPYE
jgi:AsmA protein